MNTAIDMPATPTTLTSPEKPNASEGELAITECLGKLVLRHSQLMAAYSKIQKVMAANVALEEPRHLIIAGDSGCGKTTLCDLISDEYGTRDNEFQLGIQRNITALMASVPSPVTPRSMAVNMLRALGEEGRIHGNCQELTNRLIFQFKQSDVRALFLDEQQHLFSLGLGGKRGPSTRLREAMDWVKSIINKTKLTFVMMGMPQLLDLIDADPQMARRFSHVFYLKPFDCPEADESDIAAFADDLLMSAVCDLPYFDNFEEFSKNLQNAKALYVATGGIPSRIKTLVIGAACLAHNHKHRHITMQHFTHAYEADENIREEIRKEHARQRALARARKKALAGKFLNPFSAASNDLDAACFSEAA